MVSATHRSLYPWERHQVTIVQEASWALGTVWTGPENLVSSGIWSPDRSGRMESLYRLSYPGRPVKIGAAENMEKMKNHAKMWSSGTRMTEYGQNNGETNFSRNILTRGNLWKSGPKEAERKSKVGKKASFILKFSWMCEDSGNITIACGERWPIQCGPGAVRQSFKWETHVLTSKWKKKTCFLRRRDCHYSWTFTTESDGEPEIVHSRFNKMAPNDLARRPYLWSCTWLPPPTLPPPKKTHQWAQLIRSESF